MTVLARLTLVLFLSLFSFTAHAVEDDFQFILGYVGDGISVNVNSRNRNMDTIGFSNQQAFRPSLIARSGFRPKGEFLGFKYGYFWEYGLDTIHLRQNQVYDAFVSFGYIDPGTEISGWYAKVHPVFAIKSGGVTMGLGLGLTYANINGDFMAEWADGPPTVQPLSWQELSFTTKIFMEGEGKHLIWGARIDQIRTKDVDFYYNLNFFTLYLGYKF